VVKVPTFLSLGVIAACITIAVVASLRATRPAARAVVLPDPSDQPTTPTKKQEMPS
jgi:hypothetical protein